MKIETLVDLINRERGEWQGSAVSKIVGVHAPSGYPFYYSCEQPDVINGTTWTREEFENEVAALSAALYMPKDGLLDKASKGASIQEMFYLSYPQQKESDQVHQPKHYEVVPNIQAKDMIETILNSVLTKGMSPYQVYCLGNTLKYRLRAGKKDNLQQDIDKANEYVTMGWPA